VRALLDARNHANVLRFDGTKASGIEIDGHAPAMANSLAV
jgi:hypothetical protein